MTNSEELEKLLKVLGENANKEEAEFCLLVTAVCYLAEILDILQGKGKTKHEKDTDAI